MLLTKPRKWRVRKDTLLLTLPSPKGQGLASVDIASILHGPRLYLLCLRVHGFISIDLSVMNITLTYLYMIDYCILTPGLNFGVLGSVFESVETPSM